MDALNEKVIISEAKLNKFGNFLNDISTIIYGVKDDKPDNYLGGSISQYSKNLVMTFPVLCDNTLSPETASMISKANERNITTMLQLLFTAMNIEANDGMKVLAKIHKNISTGMDVAEVADKMDQIGTRGIMYGLHGGVFTKESAEAITEMMAELKSQKYNTCFPVNSLNEESLNRFSINKTYRGTVVKEAITPDQKDIVDKVYRIIRAEDDFPKTAGQNGGRMNSEEYWKYINSPEFEGKINDLINAASVNINISDKQRDEIEAELRKMINADLENRWKESQISNNNLKNFEIQCQYQLFKNINKII